MKGWENRAIRTLGRVVTGKTPSKNIVDFWQGDELFVSPRDMEFDSRYITNTQSRISVKALKKFAGQNIPKNTVMYTALSYGFGKIGIASKQLITNQQINSIIVNKENNFRFVYYLLRINTPYIFSFNSGIDTPIVPKSVFEKIKLAIPSLLIQRKIAAILSAYDDLIENNNCRIAILEKMAEELYREWFVRLRFPGHEKVKIVKGVPEGWEIKRIGEIVSFKYGFTESSISDANFPKYLRVMDINKNSYIQWSDVPNCKIDEKDSETYALKKNDIVIARMASPGKVAIVEKDIKAVFASYLIKMSLNNKFIKPYFIFYTLRDDSYQGLFINADTSATRGSINGKVLSQFSIVLPPLNLQKQFDQQARLIREVLNKFLSSNDNLTTSRDRLLSRLMSGAIDVETMDIEFPKSMQEEAIDA